jgi:hypothetical protein
LAWALGITDGDRIIEGPYALVWLALAMGSGLALMCIGFSLGVVVNVLVARLAFGWPWRRSSRPGSARRSSPSSSSIVRMRAVTIPMVHPEERLTERSSGPACGGVRI